MMGKKNQRTRRWLGCWLLLAAALGPAACQPKMPERQGIFNNLAEAKAAYRDYLDLERRHTEMLTLKMGSDTITVSLPFYLYTLGREFERLGEPDSAVKLYLRLEMNYTLLDEENPLGQRAENRLRWILSDKAWFRPTPEALIAELRAALGSKNTAALEKLMSRDFGFGEDAGSGERVPVDYHTTVEIIGGQWPRNAEITLTPVAADARRVVLQSSGWTGQHKVWNLQLHYRDNPKGWEWDTITW